MISFTKDDLFLVTGASAGIGAATALLLNELGASVVAVARSEERLKSVQNAAVVKERFFVERKDLSKDHEELPFWLSGLSKKYGPFAGLAHCAGVSNVAPLAFEDKDQTQKLFDINFYPGMFFAQAFLRDRKLRAPAGTSLVMVSSLAYKISNEGLASYAASKGALSSLVIAAALEGARNKIRVNGVAPGLVGTELVTNTCSAEYLDRTLKRYPLGFGKAGDVASLITFLLSSRSSWVTGQNIVIDGGASIF